MSDNEDDEQTVACPICGEYEGKVSSVKSHITGTGTGEHEGKSGGQYGDLLEKRAESAGREENDDDPEGNGESAPDSGSSDGEESDGDADEPDETDDDDDTEDDVATPEEYQAQQERLNSDGSDDTTDDPDDEPAATEPVEPSGGGLGGLVDNIPTKYLAIGLLMAVVVAYLMLSGDDTDDGDVVDVEAQEPDETDDTDSVETGVMLG